MGKPTIPLVGKRDELLDSDVVRRTTGLSISIRNIIRIKQRPESVPAGRAFSCCASATVEVEHSEEFRPNQEHDEHDRYPDGLASEVAHRLEQPPSHGSSLDELTGHENSVARGGWKILGGV